MSELLVYYRNTKSRLDDDHEADVMEKMNELAEDIDYDEFCALVDPASLKSVTDPLGYGSDLPLKEDWHVGYKKSKYGGCECAVLCHSECDFIFLKPKDAAMLQEAFAQGVNPLQWERCTSFGKGGIDPR